MKTLKWYLAAAALFAAALVADSRAADFEVDFIGTLDGLGRAVSGDILWGDGSAALELLILPDDEGGAVTSFFGSDFAQIAAVGEAPGEEVLLFSDTEGPVRGSISLVGTAITELGGSPVVSLAIVTMFDDSAGFAGSTTATEFGDVVSVPEPSTLLFGGLGLLCLCGVGAMWGRSGVLAGVLALAVTSPASAGSIVFSGQTIGLSGNIRDFTSTATVDLDGSQSSIGSYVVEFENSGISPGWQRDTFVATDANQWIYPCGDGCEMLYLYQQTPEGTTYQYFMGSDFLAGNPTIDFGWLLIGPGEDEGAIWSTAPVTDVTYIPEVTAVPEPAAVVLGLLASIGLALCRT